MKKLLILITCVLFVLGIGFYYYHVKVTTPQKEVSNTKEVKINDSESLKQDETSSFREYRNLETGFAFKYPKKCGEIIVKQETDPVNGTGTVFSATAGTAGSYCFFFNFYTNDVIFGTGDDGSSGLESLDINNYCEENKNNISSCEILFSKDNTKIILFKNKPAGPEPYHLVIDLHSINLKFKKLTFTSRDKDLLITLASTFEK